MEHFQSYKGRSIADGQRVKVYFNLHNKKYSAVAMCGPDKGRVLGHFDEVVLGNVSFIVSEAGRQRVIREKKKNVHAYAVGQVLDPPFKELWGLAAPLFRLAGSKLNYNPYAMNQFYVCRTPLKELSCNKNHPSAYCPVTEADRVYLGHRGLYAVGAR